MLVALIAEHVQAFSAPERASVLWSYAHMGLRPARHTLQQILPLSRSQPCDHSSASSAWLPSEQPAAAQAQTDDMQSHSYCPHRTSVEPVHDPGTSSPQTAAHAATSHRAAGCQVGTVGSGKSSLQHRQTRLLFSAMAIPGLAGIHAACLQETEEVPTPDWSAASFATAAISGQPQQTLPLSSPQHIASFVWSCAERGHCPGSSLMSAAVARFHTSLADASPPELASFLAACARLAFRPSYAFLAAATAAWVQKLMKSADPQDIADYVWACASLSFQPGRAFLGAAAAQVHSRMPDADPQALCNLVWACARLGYHPGVAFDADARDQMQEVLRTCCARAGAKAV